MKGLLILTLTLTILSGCDKKKQDIKNIYYSVYNSEYRLIKKKEFMVEMISKKGYDSVNVFQRESLLLTYKEQIQGDGIYRFYLGHKFKTHSFKNQFITDFPRYSYPFISRHAFLKGEKSYKINGKNYLILLFEEYSGSHIGYDTYYLMNFGFICYYDYINKKIILSDEFIGIRFDNQLVNEIKDCLIKDKSFFTKYKY